MWKRCLLLLVYYAMLRVYGREAVVYNESLTWDVHHVKGIFKNQNLRFSRRNHPNPFHSCYRVICTGNQCPGAGDAAAVRDFCYPAVIVTGLPKCATSAMYDLLMKLPGTIAMAEKENCPYVRRRSHWVFFQSLPRYEEVQEDSLIIDGCIDVINNMKMRDILQGPRVYYVVMLRDYADMIWSSYNFWCHLHYDKEGCLFDRWTNKKFHARSPELFHDLIRGDANGTEMVQPFYYPMHRPCANAGGYFTEYLDGHLYRNKLANDTIAVSAEELEVRPITVLKRVTDFMNIDLDTQGMKSLNAAMRINAQDNKGTAHTIPAHKYTPGLYSISDYKPMRNETRALLDKCWRDDCIRIAERMGYYYTACLEQYLDKHRLVQLPAAVRAYAWKEDEKTNIPKQYAMQRLAYTLQP